jgi:hypothetical protein
MPNSALSSNRELDQAGTTPVLILGVRRGGQVSAVDGSTASSVGDDHAVAEQLGGKLNVRGLTAAGASAREFKQRFKQLGILDQMGEMVVRSSSGRDRK